MDNETVEPRELIIGLRERLTQCEETLEYCYGFATDMTEFVGPSEGASPPQVTSQGLSDRLAAHETRLRELNHVLEALHTRF